MAAAGVTLAVSPALAADDEKTKPPQVGDIIGNSRGDPLSPDKVRVNAGPTKAYAVSPDGVVRNGKVQNQLLVVRFSDDKLSAAAKANAADGVFAFTAICTHAGCVINGWDRNTLEFACPCHGSHFHATDDGSVAQGPAQRKLPQLGLKVADGKLVVTSGFDGRIGGDETM